jgi:hypothetical protein
VIDEAATREDLLKPLARIETVRRLARSRIGTADASLLMPDREGLVGVAGTLVNRAEADRELAQTGADIAELRELTVRAGITELWPTLQEIEGYGAEHAPDEERWLWDTWHWDHDLPGHVVALLRAARDLGRGGDGSA